MKRIYFFLFIILFPQFIFSQKNESIYFQQEVNYKINVLLDDKAHSLQGDIEIEYINNSPDELKKIAIHIWPNAFKNKSTAYFQQQVFLGNIEKYRTTSEHLGYLDSLSFAVDGVPLRVDVDPKYIDVVWLRLQEPLKPGSSTTLSTPFYVKIPDKLSRLGHVGQSYQISQWFPKPAVYDAKGWHPMPYLDQGEFYSEFGRFDVSITLPQNYVVAATGELVTESEKVFLQERIEVTKIAEHFKEISLDTIPLSSKQLKTISYKANNVHDFAWFADKRFKVDKSEVVIEGSKIDTWAFYTKSQSEWWKKGTHYLNRSIKFYSDHVGPYKYPQATAVQSPLSTGVGMEYPMITLIGLEPNEKSLDVVITHEVGHNWFYGMLGSNERDFPWMDEGLNSFFENKYVDKFYLGEEEHFIPKILHNKGNVSDVKVLIKDYQNQRNLLPPSTPVFYQDDMTYYINAYEYPTIVFQELEKKMSSEKFSKAIKKYFDTWSGKHPSPKDLQEIFESECGCELSDVFKDKLQNGESINLDKTSKQKIRFPLLGGVQNTNYQDLYWSPMLGYNNYDKGMIGLWIHNITLPTKSFNFSFTPMYSFNTKELVGVGEIRKNWLLENGMFKRISARLNLKKFSSNFNNDYDAYNNYVKFEPEVTLTLRNKNAYTKNETYLSLRHTKIFQKNVIGISVADNLFRYERSEFVVNELSFKHINNYSLAPSKSKVVLQQGKGFLKIMASYHQQIVYNKPSRGFFIHAFGGAFLKDNNRNSSLAFQANGVINSVGLSNDYLYDQFLFGRSAFSGIFSQQVFLRDAEVKTLAINVRGEDWMLGAGVSTNLPIPVPIHAYADFAITYDVFDAKTKLSYSTGLSLVVKKDVFEVFFPVFESQDIRESITYLNRSSYWEKVSFLLNLNWIRPIQNGEEFFKFAY